MRKIGFTLLPAILCLLPNAAVADEIVNGSAGLASPSQILSFSEVVVPSGTALSTQYSSYGVAFTNAFYDPQPGFLAPGINQPLVGNFTQSTPAVNPMIMDFDAVYFDVAFQVFSYPSGQDTVFSAYHNGTLVDTFSWPTTYNTGSSWYGFTNTTGINEIQITGGGYQGAFLLTNLEFGQVPEPATLPLAVTGLFGLLALTRRRTT